MNAAAEGEPEEVPGVVRCLQRHREVSEDVLSHHWEVPEGIPSHPEAPEGVPSHREAPEVERGRMTQGGSFSALMSVAVEGTTSTLACLFWRASLTPVNASETHFLR